MTKRQGQSLLRTHPRSTLEVPTLRVLGQTGRVRVAQFLPANFAGYLILFLCAVKQYYAFQSFQVCGDFLWNRVLH